MATTITRRFARYIALPAVSAGILGGAALGLLASRTLKEGVAHALRAGLEYQVQEARIQRTRCDRVDVDACTA